MCLGSRCACQGSAHALVLGWLWCWGAAPWHETPGVPWASFIKEQDLSMAGIRVETALGELPGYPEVTSLFVFVFFSLLLVQSGIHVVFFFF